MKCLPLLLFFTSFHLSAQTLGLKGRVADENNQPVSGAHIAMQQKDKQLQRDTTNEKGEFTMPVSAQGFYYISIAAPGFEELRDTFAIDNTGTPPPARVWELHHMIHQLDEAKVTEKILAMVQKDDTLEFNSAAFKVNPDADAADLIKKMPTIEINNKAITAQGESVLKILVDGKPFFGDDPYMSLKNLPAEIIGKVQVYNEKTDEEQLTGFSEGPTTKTINIITKPGNRNGLFGKVYAGYGGSGDDGRYGVGESLNKFGGDRRITVTAQSNNVNVQNFTDGNQGAAGGGNAGGLTATNAAGINYTDKWGKKTDITGSYSLNETNTTISRDTRKTYVLAADSGQVYNEASPATSKGYTQRCSMRLHYVPDTLNTFIFQPQFSLNNSSGSSQRDANTTEGALPINTTTSSNTNSRTGLNLAGNLLYSHKFRKKGRTFSVSMNANNNAIDGDNLNASQNIYYNSPALSDSLHQHALQNQNTWNLAGGATYTEPTGKYGLLKLEYNITYIPASSEKNTYDFLDSLRAYSTLPDTLYSNSFRSTNIAHKAGASYLMHLKNVELSAGLNYQLTELSGQQRLPVAFALNRHFENVLPVATIHYKISKTSNLQLTYNTNTQPPSVSQLQNVVNNNDPLHLYTGNPELKQPYRHNLTMRYSGMGRGTKNNFSASVTGGLIQNYIASNSIIAANDTAVQHIALPKGSQLTMPVNIAGYKSLNANVSYGVPLAVLKCRLNMSLNAAVNEIPAIINNQLNYQDNKNTGLGLSVSSNISENIDFIISSNSGIAANSNSINKQLNTTYFTETSNATINLILSHGFVINTSLAYQANPGLPAGYNQSYLLWNAGFGKKVFKKHQGDIRLSVYDLLNENNNIQHTVADIYIQDTRSNILQRYLLLAFTYKISEFKK